MTETSELIDAIAASAKPVRRLKPPIVRALAWLAFAVILLGLLSVNLGFRSDLAQQIEQSFFVMAVGSSFATGILAGISAFLISLPDRSRRWLLLPLPALLLWLSSISYGCLTDWISVGPSGIDLGETARCFSTLVLIAIPLMLVIFVLLRHAAHVRATETILAASIAVSGIAATGLALFHALDASILVLLSNLGAIALTMLFGHFSGNRMFAMLSPRPAAFGGVWAYK